jgi:CheY-like chemotaxis protein
MYRLIISLIKEQILAKKSDGMVLYVEDDKIIAEMVMSRMETFEILWAKSSQEACKLIIEHQDKLDVILMDIMLQGSDLDGIQLTKLIRGKPISKAVPDYAANLPKLSLPIIFVSAYGDKYSEDVLKQAGGNTIVSKPIDFAKLNLALTQIHLQNLFAK